VEENVEAKAWDAHIKELTQGVKDSDRELGSTESVKKEESLGVASTSVIFVEMSSDISVEITFSDMVLILIITKIIIIN
jgi:hypothetical protein